MAGGYARFEVNGLYPVSRGRQGKLYLWKSTHSRVHGPIARMSAVLDAQMWKDTTAQVSEGDKIDVRLDCQLGKSYLGCGTYVKAWRPVTDVVDE